ncbi:N-acetylglucosamine-6-phosphate deacetylase, partial [Glutamicibacter creatinolyticus]
PGPLAACLEQARQGQAVVELIADGVHLDPDTVRMVFTLVGAANVVLVTDSMAATGLADGNYELGPQQVTVADGQARLSSDG